MRSAIHTPQRSQLHQVFVVVEMSFHCLACLKRVIRVDSAISALSCPLSTTRTSPRPVCPRPFTCRSKTPAPIRRAGLCAGRYLRARGEADCPFVRGWTGRSASVGESYFPLATERRLCSGLRSFPGRPRYACLPPTAVVPLRARDRLPAQCGHWTSLEVAVGSFRIFSRAGRAQSCPERRYPF